MTEIFPGWGTDPSAYESPLTDLKQALKETPFSASVSPERLEPVELEDVARVELAYVSYHGAKWTVEEGVGSELQMMLLAELKDGRWMAVEAYNDYTGWGCQDSSDVRIGTREDCITHGLSNEARRALGLEDRII